MDPLELYREASAWTLTKVAGATDLDAATPCTEWDVRTLLNHVLQTQQYFAGAARGEDAQPPGGDPPELLGENPVVDFEQARADTLDAFGADGGADRTGPMLGIAFSDMLLHGWDLARATGQETAMPAGLAAAAYDLVHGAFTDEQREGVFGPELPVAPTASAQQRLLAYTGRDPG